MSIIRTSLVVTLQAVSVEGSVGLNAAAGAAAMSLRKAP
jgi:hypothetical protein